MGPLFGTIDRYVLSQFLRNYVLSMFVLVGLWVVLDMVFNFDEFVKPSGADEADTNRSSLNVVLGIADFYAYQSFRYFNHMAGVIPVVATAFTMLRMSRFNELAALLAAGVPLLRVAAPILYASAALNLILLPINQELIVPAIADQLQRRHGETVSSREGRPLQAIHDGVGSLLFAGRYTPATQDAARMDAVSVITREGDRVTLLVADAAEWDSVGSQWVLEGGSARALSYDGTSASDARPVDVWQTSLSPAAIRLIISRGDYVDLLDLQTINRLLALPGDVGRSDLLRVREARLASYFVNIVLVALAIPCVLTREPLLLRTSTFRLFGLVGACLGVVFLTQAVAGLPPADAGWAQRWPALMAWLPVLVFAPVAVWLMDRIRS
jgi:lipopolysaccharide export LptBFGC system permease protein LptF